VNDGSRRASGSGLDAVFSPRRVALVGASERAGTVGRLLWDNLADFPGEVVPVCPSGSVRGTVAYADLREIPGEVDLAVIATPAAAVPDVVRAAADKGVGAAVVLSAGFAETGPAGARLQAEAVAAARAGNVRLVGPNCFGVQNADLPLNASIAAGTPRGGGGISIVTQSGSYGMAVHTLAAEEALRVAKVYAAGNKAEISDAELLAYLREDPATRVICLMLESVTDARRFFAEACRTTPVKPVIAAVGARTGPGRRAAVSHTAALASDDAIREAALAQAGVVRVRTGLEVFDAARALAGQPAPSGRRAAVLTNSGGIGVELADLLADEHLELPELSGSLQDALRPLLPGYASVRNPVDTTPAWSRYLTAYPAAIELLARSGEVDLVIVVLVHRAASREIAEAVRDAVGRLRADRVPVPVYACWVAPRGAQPQADLLQRAGVPCYAWPDRAARAAGAAVRCGLRRVPAPPRTPVSASGAAGRTPRPSRTPVSASGAAGRTPRPSRTPASASGAAARAPLPPPAPNHSAGTSLGSDPHRWHIDRVGPGGLLDTGAARDLLAGAGIPVIETALCASPSAAAAAARRLGYPVAAKVAHPELTHKTDAGGVRLGLGTAAAVRRAARDLLALADGAGVLVQPQGQGVELVVGGLRDPQFGPVVLAGLGGILAEARDDAALAVAPVDEAAAIALLRSLRGSVVLDGLRGQPAVDLGAVAGVIVRVGRLLADAPEILELDLNPVLASGRGCVAVDWRIRIG
jgi:acetyltransferase